MTDAEQEHLVRVAAAMWDAARAVPNPTDSPESFYVGRAAASVMAYIVAQCPDQASKAKVFADMLAACLAGTGLEPGLYGALLGKEAAASTANVTKH